MSTFTLLPAALGTYCDAAGSTEHDYTCLMSLAESYFNHGRTAMSLECLWGAFDTARRMSRPDLAYVANEMLGMVNEAANALGSALVTLAEAA